MSLASLLGIDEIKQEVEETVEEKAVSLTPFDFVKSITYDKNDLFSEHGEVAEKSYAPYIVNRSLSFSQDTVLFANEMNRYFNSIPKSFQYQFLVETVRKRKRYDKWVKGEQESEDMSLIKKYYGYNNEKAKEALKMMPPEEISRIRKKMDKGGIKKKEKR